MTASNENVRSGDWSGLFRILAKGAEIKPSHDEKFAYVCSGSARLKVPLDDLALLAGKGLVRRDSRKICLTQAGENLASSSVGVSIHVVGTRATKSFVARNEDESPLNALRRLKGVDGKPFLSERQFEAGEKLRADFTRGHLSPRISANWQASVASGRRSGSAGSMDDLTNAALDARKRFEAALDGIGPDLGGALMDVCCYLKGLELVEIERRWPKRSAKFMLRAGLTLLAMHYHPEPRAKPIKSHRWGSDDYKPAIK